MDGLQAARVRALLAREELHRAARRGGRGTAGTAQEGAAALKLPRDEAAEQLELQRGAGGRRRRGGERGRGVRRIGIEIGGHALPNLAAAGVIGGGFEFVFHD